MYFLGDLREQVEQARKVTEEQKVVLDKIRHIHRFFEGLEVVCGAVEDVRTLLVISFRKINDARSSIHTLKLCLQLFFHYTR